MKRCNRCDGVLRDVNYGVDEHKLEDCMRSIGARLQALRVNCESVERGELRATVPVRTVLDSLGARAW